MLAVLFGCNAYDADLLDNQDNQNRSSGTAAKGGKDGSSGMAGKAGAGEGGVGSVAGKSGGSAAGSGGSGGAGTSGTSGEDAGASGGGAGGAGAAAGGGSSGAGTGGMGGAGMAGPCVSSGTLDCCPDDPAKQDPGVCGCGVPEVDTDLDTIADCDDDAPYGWLRQLTLDGAQIGGTLTDFPLLVQLTDSHLQSAAAADGSDIYFSAADKTTPLDFEIESYASSTGALVAWVRMPALSAGSNAVLYLGYDDGKPNRSNTLGVWNVYRHVWHLAQDPSGGNGAIKDATQRADGTAQGGMSLSARVAAVAGNGFNFDGMNDEITFTNDVTGNGASTLSGWVKQAADSGDNGSSIISIGNGSSNQARFLLPVADQDNLKFGFYGNDKITSTKLPLDAWKHVVWVWTGAQSTLYVDGAVVFGPTSHTNANTNGTAGSIGGSTFGYDFFMTGQLDEVRIATDARPAAWITTEFNNQKPGSTFFKSVGAPQSAPSH